MSPYGKGKVGGNRANRIPCYSLRLQPSLLAEARRVANSERVALNQWLNVCVAEKLSALRAEESFQKRILRVAPAGILQILEQARKLKSSMGDT
jgi:hypothetical protein